MLPRTDSAGRRYQDRAAGARRYEYGNPNFLGIWVQRRSALMVEEWGRANIEARILLPMAEDQTGGSSVSTDAGGRVRVSLLATNGQLSDPVARVLNQHEGSRLKFGPTLIDNRSESRVDGSRPFVR